MRQHAGSAARFWSVDNITIDASGNLFVTDFGLIRKITSDGVVTTVAGQSGYGESAAFVNCRGIVADQSGNLILSQEQGGIRMMTSAGVVTTIAGANIQGETVDGIGNSAGFRLLAGITIDGSGNLFLADSADFVVRKGSPVDANALASITTPPADTIVKVGASASFSISATSPSTPIAYQWQWKFGGRPDWEDLTDDNTISGANTSSLTINPTTAALNGAVFRCVLTNIAGSTMSPTALLAVVVPDLRIVKQPAATYATDGYPAYFAADATGIPLSTIKGQWQRSTDGDTTWTDLSSSESGISGETSPTLHLTATQAAMDGYGVSIKGSSAMVEKYASRDTLGAP